MAKIYLRSRREAIFINDKRVEQLKKDWINKTLPEKIEVDGEVFNSKDIRGFSGIGLAKRVKEYNLDDPQDRAEIKAFEKEWEKWLLKNSSYKGAAQLSEKWFADLGASKIDERREEKWKRPHVIVVDSDLYSKLRSKWSALGELCSRRTYTKRLEKEVLKSLTN